MGCRGRSERVTRDIWGVGGGERGKNAGSTK